MTVDRTFLSDVEPFVMEDELKPAAQRKIRPSWFKRLRRIVADLGLLEDSIAAMPDSKASIFHGNSSALASATLTLDITTPRQRISNNGAFTLVAPTADGSCVLLIQNLLSAGAVTFSGFTTQAPYRGVTLTTTAGDWFLLRIDVIGGFALVKITQETT